MDGVIDDIEFDIKTHRCDREINCIRTGHRGRVGSKPLDSKDAKAIFHRYGQLAFISEWLPGLLRDAQRQFEENNKIKMEKAKEKERVRDIFIRGRKGSDVEKLLG